MSATSYSHRHRHRFRPGQPGRLPGPRRPGHPRLPERNPVVSAGRPCRASSPTSGRSSRTTLKELCDRESCCLVVTTGGTGPARRDVTPEATEAVCDKLLDGFGELMRAVSLQGRADGDPVAADRRHSRPVADRQPAGQAQRHPRLSARRVPGHSVLHRSDRGAVSDDERSGRQGVSAQIIARRSLVRSSLFLPFRRAWGRSAPTWWTVQIEVGQLAHGRTGILASNLIDTVAEIDEALLRHGAHGGHADRRAGIMAEAA